MKYQCHKCLKEFSQKSNFEYHMRRIRPCTNINSNKKRPYNDVLIKSLQNPPISEEILQNPPISEENFKLANISNNFTCSHCE